MPEQGSLGVGFYLLPIRKRSQKVYKDQEN